MLRDGVAHIDEAYARAGKAEATARGRVALDANKDFAVSGRLANFDPSRFGKYDSARINSRFDFKGQLEPVIQVAANVDVTDSRLLGLPATATGTLRSRRTDHPEVAMDVSLRVGDTHATAKGTVKDPARMASMDLALTLAGGSSPSSTRSSACRCRRRRRIASTAGSCRAARCGNCASSRARSVTAISPATS